VFVGRDRTLDYAQVNKVVSSAKEIKTTTPKEIKHHLNLNCSCRTVRRRLDEAGLFGRVAETEPDYTDEQLQQRVNFGEG
jgi:hypothetical protein